VFRAVGLDHDPVLPGAYHRSGAAAPGDRVLLAHRAGVVLYAPPAGAGHADALAPSTGSADGMASAGAAANDAPPASTFDRSDFRHDPDRDLLLCPAGETLQLIGVYAEPHRAAYRIYGRWNCGTCALKPQCTTGRGRRVKLRVAPTGRSPSPKSQPANATHDIPSSALTTALAVRPGEVAELVHALAARMRLIGDRIKTFRAATVEPVNAQLKQHGVGRFHVHGFARCSTVLTLGCIAHNLMKWKAREAARALRAVA